MNAQERNPDAFIFYSAEKQQKIVTNIVEPAPIPEYLYQALELDKGTHICKGYLVFVAYAPTGSSASNSKPRFPSSLSVLRSSLSQKKEELLRMVVKWIRFVLLFTP
jgi:hypothetical protein